MKNNKYKKKIINKMTQLYKFQYIKYWNLYEDKSRMLLKYNNTTKDTNS